MICLEQVNKSARRAAVGGQRARGRQAGIAEEGVRHGHLLQSGTHVVWVVGDGALWPEQTYVLTTEH